jgi:hypothetical protein
MQFQKITELSADVSTSASYPLHPGDYPGQAIQVGLWMEINCLLVNWKLSKLYGRTPHEVAFSMTAQKAKLFQLIARIVRLSGFRGDSPLKNNRPTTAKLKRARVRSPKNSARGGICYNAACLKIITQIHVVCLWFILRRRPYRQSDRIYKKELIWDTGGGGRGCWRPRRTDWQLLSTAHQQMH